LTTDTTDLQSEREESVANTKSNVSNNFEDNANEKKGEPQIVAGI